VAAEPSQDAHHEMRMGGRLASSAKCGAGGGGGHFARGTRRSRVVFFAYFLLVEAKESTNRRINDSLSKETFCYPIPMTNGEIAAVFERIALILDLKGDENPFRVRAYARAAETIANMSKSLRTIYEEGELPALRAIPGIGEDLSLKIEEMVKTGKLGYLATIEKKVPKGLLEVLEIEGMGPKKTKFVWQKFKVQSIADLQKLAESGKLEDLKGWGEKSVANILRGIEQRAKVSGRLPLPVAAPLVEELLDALRKSGLCEKVEAAGSFRRKRESVGDIDILVTSRKPQEVMDVFCSLPQVESVTAKGDTKSTVFLKAGLDADLRVVDPKAFGAALLYFTGSKDHNVHIRRIGIAKGLTLNEYGLSKGTAARKGALVAAETEEAVYKAIGLPHIPPELREDRGEIEAAQQNKLPRLITEKDIQGDLHMHTNFSDGAASPEQMVAAAKKKGLSYIAITDHASAMGMVRGMKKTGNSFRQYLHMMRALRDAEKGIRIFIGAEVDIEADGSLYLPDDMLRELDWVVASVHGQFHQSLEETTSRLIRALQNPYVHVLGHPTARLLGKREGITFDIDTVLKAAKAHGKAVELNTSFERLDLPDTHLKRAKEIGVRISMGSDAHALEGIDHRFGIFQARRGWLEKGDVLNALSQKEMERYCSRRK